jgi:hypothetical protein
VSGGGAIEVSQSVAFFRSRSPRNEVPSRPSCPVGGWSGVVCRIVAGQRFRAVEPLVFRWWWLRLFRARPFVLCARQVLQAQVPPRALLQAEVPQGEVLQRALPQAALLQAEVRAQVLRAGFVRAQVLRQAQVLQAEVPQGEVLQRALSQAEVLQAEVLQRALPQGQVLQDQVLRPGTLVLRLTPGHPSRTNEPGRTATLGVPGRISVPILARHAVSWRPGIKTNCGSLKRPLEEPEGFFRAPQVPKVGPACRTGTWRHFRVVAGLRPSPTDVVAGLPTEPLLAIHPAPGPARQAGPTTPLWPVSRPSHSWRSTLPQVPLGKRDLLVRCCIGT